MRETVSVQQIEAILAVTDALGIHRERVVIPLAPTSPGRVRCLPGGKFEITVDAGEPFEEWLTRLPALLAAAQGG